MGKQEIIRKRKQSRTNILHRFLDLLDEYGIQYYKKDNRYMIDIYNKIVNGIVVKYKSSIISLFACIYDKEYIDNYNFIKHNKDKLERNSFNKVLNKLSYKYMSKYDPYNKKFTDEIYKSIGKKKSFGFTPYIITVFMAVFFVENPGYLKQVAEYNKYNKKSRQRKR